MNNSLTNNMFRGSFEDNCDEDNFVDYKPDHEDFDDEEEDLPEATPPSPQRVSPITGPAPGTRQKGSSRKTPPRSKKAPLIKFTFRELENASGLIHQYDLVFEQGEGNTMKGSPGKRCLQRDKLLYLQIRKWEAEAMRLCEILLERFCVQNPDGMSVYQNTFSNYYTEGCDLRALLVTTGFASRHPKTAKRVFEQIQDVIMRLWHDGLSNRMSEIITKEKKLTWGSHLKSHKTAGS